MTSIREIIDRLPTAWAVLLVIAAAISSGAAGMRIWTDMRAEIPERLRALEMQVAEQGRSIDDAATERREQRAGLRYLICRDEEGRRGGDGGGCEWLLEAYPNIRARPLR